MSRSRTVFMTGFWMVAFQAMNLVQQLLIIPLFLHYWTASLYGDWLEISSVAAWFGMADAGLQSYVINRLTEWYARERWDELRSDLANATLMFLLAVGVGFTALLIATAAMPIDAHFQAQHRPLAGSAAMTLGLLGAYIVTLIFGGFLSGLYRALGRADRGQQVSFVQRLFVLGATIAVLVTHGTPVELAGSYLLISFVLLAWIAWDTRRMDARLTPMLDGASWRTAVGFLGPSFHFLVLDKSRDLTLWGTVIVVSEMLGSTSVVVLSTTRTMINALRQITTVLSNAVWPELTRISARGERDRLVLAHGLIVKLTSTLALVGTVILFFSGTDIYELWTHRATDQRLLRLFLLDVLAGTPAMASVVILQATSQLRAMAILQSVTGISNVIACALLVRYLGVSAAAVTPLIFTVTVFGTWVPAHVQKFLGEPARRYWTEIYWPLAWMTGATLVVTRAVHHLVPHGLAGFLAESIVAFATATLLARVILFKPHEVSFLTDAVRRMLRRPSPAVLPEGT